jgi:hypothetical protein
MIHLEGLLPRLHRENDLLGLVFRKGPIPWMYYVRILTAEFPNDLKEFSIGSANALAAAGTGWETVDDSNGKEFLEPEEASKVNQVFYGIAPSQARVYRQYPTNIDRGSLVSTRAIGSQVGYVDGRQSPLLYPSPTSEFFVVKGHHPAFMGYHPYAQPSSISVYMNFYVASYGVIELDPAQLSMEQKLRTRRITMGGVSLMEAPSWLKMGHETTSSGPTGG